MQNNGIANNLTKKQQKQVPYVKGIPIFYENMCLPGICPPLGRALCLNWSES